MLIRISGLLPDDERAMNHLDESQLQLVVPPAGRPHSPSGRSATDDAQRPSATSTVSAGFILVYALASFGALLVLLTPSLESLALRINASVPVDEAPGVLGTVLAIGLILQVLALPIIGRLSDRTRSRFGRRRPWIVLGSIGLLVGALVMALVPSIIGLAIGYAVVSVSGSSCVAALLAVMSDRVPVRQRGLVSAFLGLGTVAALVVGSVIVALLPSNSGGMFVVPAIIGVILLALFAALMNDRPSSNDGPLPKVTVAMVVSTFWVSPRRYPDFGWAYLSRFLLQLAYAFLTTYQAFYLISHLGTAADDVPGKVLTGTLLLGVATIISSVVAGRLSDKLARRKVFVITASFITAGALLVIAGANDLTLFYVGLVLGGIGYGGYTAVDLALATDVLPNPDDAANDLAIFNTASTLPQALAPAIAPFILAIAAQSYSVLYVVAAAVAVGGGFIICRVRAVR
ncbi:MULTISPECIES: MFS transporter [unclassified Streptomyces]|uniref:MFS transporter n=1 Tax=unclassified Streptomyces TaxID=2593676 RepID=UPI0036E607D7